MSNEPSAYASVAPASSQPFPSRVLACYFTTWDPTYNITQVPLDFNVIYVFNAQPQGPVLADGTRNNTGDGTFWLPDMGAPQISSTSVQQCRARGQKVILTVGGAGCGFNFDMRAESTNFVNSFKAMYDGLGGVDGCDFNNFEAHVGTSATELVWICQQLKALYGKDFAITMPPVPDGGYSPNDRTLAKALHDNGLLTYAGPQFYDWSGFKTANVVANYIDEWCTLLGDETQVVVGLSANYDYTNSLTQAECGREIDTIMSKYPNIRGVFCWSAQNQMSAGNVWGADMKARLGRSGQSRRSA